MEDKKRVKTLMEPLVRIINTYSAFQKSPFELKEGLKVYPSEMHLVCLLKEYPDLNVTEFGIKLGITKGAVSQVVKKVESKKLIYRYKTDNKKDVILRLTEKGEELSVLHDKIINEQNGLIETMLLKYSEIEIQLASEILEDMRVVFMALSQEE